MESSSKKRNLGTDFDDFYSDLENTDQQQKPRSQIQCQNLSMLQPQAQPFSNPSSKEAGLNGTEYTNSSQQYGFLELISGVGQDASTSNIQLKDLAESQTSLGEIRVEVASLNNKRKDSSDSSQSESEMNKSARGTTLGHMSQVLDFAVEEANNQNTTQLASSVQVH